MTTGTKKDNWWGLLDTDWLNFRIYLFFAQNKGFGVLYRHFLQCTVVPLCGSRQGIITETINSRWKCEYCFKTERIQTHPLISYRITLLKSHNLCINHLSPHKTEGKTLYSYSMDNAACKSGSHFCTLKITRHFKNSKTITYVKPDCKIVPKIHISIKYDLIKPFHRIL